MDADGDSDVATNAATRIPDGSVIHFSVDAELVTDADEEVSLQRTFAHFPGEN